MARRTKVERGSGNVFADIGLPDADTLFLKAQIAAEIYRLVNARKLTQAKAGAMMGISQPEVSRLLKGNLQEYSVERLIGFLTAFDRDVEIRVKPHKKAGRAGKVTFTAAPPLRDRLGGVAEKIARAPRTGKKADKKFFDALSGH